MSTTYKIQSDLLEEIANAIRFKTGENKKINPADFPKEILSIEKVEFEVIGGVSTPPAPLKNTIWVYTDKTVSNWDLSAIAPQTPNEGMVWIEIGISGTLKFNLLKDKGIYIYPICARQYINNKWVNKVAKVYQNNNWEELNQLLYKNGSEFLSFTGGWIGNAQKNSGSIKCYANEGEEITSYTSNKIDLSRYSTLVVKISSAGFENTASNWISISTNPNSQPSSVITLSNFHLQNQEVSIDISSLKDFYYINIGCAGNENFAWIEFNEVRLK